MKKWCAVFAIWLSSTNKWLNHILKRFKCSLGSANDVAKYINNIVAKEENNYRDKINSLSITKNTEPYKDSVKTYLKASENGNTYLGEDVTFNLDLLDEYLM